MYVDASRGKERHEQPVLACVLVGDEADLPARLDDLLDLVGRAPLGDDLEARLLPDAEEPLVEEAVVERPRERCHLEADEREHVAEDLPVADVSGHEEGGPVARQVLHRAADVAELHAVVPVLVADHARHREGVDHEEAEHVADRGVDDLPLELDRHRRERPRHAAARPLAAPRRAARVDAADEPRRLHVLLGIERRKQRGDRSGRRVLGKFDGKRHGACAAGRQRLTVPVSASKRVQLRIGISASAAVRKSES